MKVRDDEPSPVDLTPLKNASEAPVFDPARERALLAAFDAAWAGPRSRPRSRAWRPLAAAAVIVLCAGAMLFVARRPDRTEHGTRSIPTAHSAPQIAAVPVASSAIAPRTSARRTGARAAARRTSASSHRAPSMFVPWPGAETLPAFESGRLVRLDLPESVAISIGLSPRATRSGVIRADMLVGQDGLARAVRIAPVP
jgi:hypothetical protein